MGFIFGPTWFYSIGLGFEIFAILVTVLIAFYSFRVFMITRYRKYLYFTLSFLFITFSYIIRAAADYLAYTHLIGKMPNVTAAVSQIAPMPIFYGLAYGAHVFFMFAGFMILVAIFLRIESVKTLSLLFILVLILAYLSQSTFMAFHITLFIMLFYIVFYLFYNFSKKKSLNSFIVLYSMVCLLISQIFFLFVVFNRFYFVIGNTLQLVGFMLLLLNMVLVFRK